MGRMIIILVILMSVVFSTYLISLHDKSSEIPKVMTETIIEQDLDNIAGYSLGYAYNQIKNKHIVENDLIVYPDFKILSGSIDSIRFDFDFDYKDKKTIRVLSYTSISDDYSVKKHHSELILEIRNAKQINPVGNWKFEKGNDIMIDHSGNNNDGTFINKTNENGNIDGWDSDRFGVTDNAMVFENQTSGQQGVLKVQNDLTFNKLTEGYVEVSNIKFERFTRNGGIIHRGEHKNYKDEAWSLQLWGTSGMVMFAIKNNSGRWKGAKSKNGALELDTNYMIAGSWDPDWIKLYINGEVVKKVKNTIGAVKDSNAPIIIGAQSEFHNGIHAKIDEVQIVNRVLTDYEVKKEYINSCLVLYYNFDEKDSTIVYDKSGNNFNGILHDGYHNDGVDLPKRIDGKVNNGLEFNGIDNMVVAGVHNAFNLPTGGALVTWAYLYNDPPYDSYIFHKNDSPVWKTACYAFGIKKKQMKGSYLRLWGRKKTYVNYKNNGTTLSPNKWYHLAGSWDDETAKVYINGNCVASEENESQPVKQLDVPLIIGAGIKNGNFTGNRRSRSFYGVLDEVKIFYKMMTEDEIQTIYNLADEEINQNEIFKILYWKE